MSNQGNQNQLEQMSNQGNQNQLGPKFTEAEWLEYQKVKSLPDHSGVGIGDASLPGNLEEFTSRQTHEIGKQAEQRLHRTETPKKVADVFASLEADPSTDIAPPFFPKTSQEEIDRLLDAALGPPKIATVIGAAYAEACHILDNGIDLRDYEAPKFLSNVLNDLNRCAAEDLDRVSEPADDAPDAPIVPIPGGGWDEEDPGDEETFRQLDKFLTAFSSPIEKGLGQLEPEDVDGMIFVEFFNRFSASHHLDMIEKGFWDDPEAAKAREAIDRIGNLKQDGLLDSLSPGETEAIGDLVGIAIGRAEQKPRNDLSDIMLMVTELAEAAEGGRKDPNAPDDKIPEFTIFEAELADVVLRIQDFAAGRELRVAEAMVAKKAFNRTRDRLHGKTC